MQLQTPTDIANLTLGLLGSTVTISNIETDSSLPAKILRRHFDLAVETVMQLHPWKVYTKTGALELTTDPSEFKWAYTYAVPFDCVIVRRIANDAKFFYMEDYQMNQVPFEPVMSSSGYVIKANLPRAYAEYTARPAAGAGIPIHVARAISNQLAKDSAASMITNNFIKMKAELFKDLKNDMANQIAIDISMSPEPIASVSPFIRVRMNE